MDLDKYFNILIKLYNLEYLYNKYKQYCILNALIKESFYWFLIYFSNILKEKQNMIYTLSTSLILIYSLSIPIEKHLNFIKAELILKIKTSNTIYFYNKILKLSKIDLLHIDLVEIYTIIEKVNHNLEEFINNDKNKFEIPVRFLTLIFIAINKNDLLLITLIVIYYFTIKCFNNSKINIENCIIKKSFLYENKIRNYFINNKNNIINNIFNSDYINKNINLYENENNKILNLNNTLNFKCDIVILCIILIVIFNRIKSLNYFEFYYFFRIIYDIEHSTDKLNEYYKNKINYNKSIERLDYLFSLKENKNNIMNDNIDINNIIIKSIYNKNPTILLNKPLYINKNDHILIDGSSGSGKTSLLYILKGILIPDQIECEPKLEYIYNKTYLSLPNHKNLFNSTLYDIISNYEENPDIDLINYSINESKFIIKNNDYIYIEKLSGGERIRLLIAKNIYNIKKYNFNILLFDEIDENLNDDLAYEICNHIKNIFNDKIILYISHNTIVKKLFTKKIIIKDGVIIL
jgi:ABC-type lipoprotein export system ATPase subunit